MATPLRNKLYMWRSSKRGIKSRFSDDVLRPVFRRDDVPDVVVSSKMNRGDRLQEARLKRYPSIDVEKDSMYAGEIDGNLDDARDALIQLGFRNNPTAYVEVTEEHGPDDGSYSLQQISEDGGNKDLIQVTSQPSFWKRTKLQFHAAIWELQDKTIFLVHKEVSAWLQPARHIWDNEANARIGVRDFRDIWYDEFEEELDGKDKVKWDTTH